MRSKLVFLLALIMGVITTILFFQYIQQFGKSAEAVADVPMVEVVTVKQAIEMNQTITEEMLELADIPEGHKHPQSVATIDEAVGKFATAAMEPGEVVLTHRLKSEKEETLYVSRKIQEGYQAVSVGVSFVQTVSNLIEPEDVVNVYLTVENPPLDENLPPEYFTTDLLTDARVLAVGRKMIAPLDGEDAYAEYTAVTLEVTSDDARNLINGSHKGTLHLTLHSSLIPGEESEKE